MRNVKVILNGDGHSLVGDLVDWEMSSVGPYSVPEYRVHFMLDEDATRRCGRSYEDAVSMLATMAQGRRKHSGDLCLKAEKVIYNPPATIVLWKDRTKTVVKCDPEDVFDEMKGLALCYMKKALGNTSRELNKALRNR